ncbi:MAG: hypothetical protein U9Q22_02370 [Candidatus Altiarchaeota archaeon]|nr:hypothetical protein [Candidatus Altiarchaeota archaeon]
MKKRGWIKIGGMLVLLAFLVVASTAASAEQTFIKGRGALYAEGEGTVFLGVARGATVMELTESTVIIHGRSNTLVWADEGDLQRYGNTWIFSGSGELHTRGWGYHAVVIGEVDRMLATGRGFAFLDGDFEYMTLGWHLVPDIDQELVDKIDPIVSLAQGVKNGEVTADQDLDNELRDLTKDLVKGAPIQSIGNRPGFLKARKRLSKMG